MSFLVGKTKQLPASNEATTAAQQQLVGSLIGAGPMGQLFPGSQVDPAMLQPYLDLFTQQNARNFAQAKESAGNLTGSSLGNIIGSEAARANLEQGAFLTNLMEARRTNDANRYLSALLGSLGSPAGQVQNVYQPGFLDYLFQGASQAAPYIFPGKGVASPKTTTGTGAATTSSGLPFGHPR